ncbi:DUF2586 family protein [Mesoflavibacter sp. CH_XMU1404-2]|uniref:DUF2586 family protein n=1 Tax=Mesoflavibacter sp. CH_XMU1404-2 TaxID=3107766 RepID=UPI003009A2EE
MLPGLNIKFTNGNIGNVVSTEDGVLGLIASAVAVADTFELDKAYEVKSMQDVAALGITPDVNNYHLYKALEEFYAEAGSGTKLWLMGVAKTTTVTSWFTVNVGTGKAPVHTMLDKAKGEISGVFTCYDPSEAITVENGMDADVPLAIAAAQKLAEDYTKDNYAPFYVILEAYGYTGVASDLPALTERTDNRVAVFVGETKERTGDVSHNGAASQVLAGRLSTLQVQENAGKVKRGSLETLTAFIVDDAVEDVDVEALHDKGYITFRTHARKAGYYFTDDPLATDPEEDYNGIARRRVIDKAYRLAHNVASEEILEDFTLTNQGAIDPFYAASVEGNIEREIATKMTANGELSASPTDKDDLGVKAKFDAEANVSTTNKINLTLQVRPKGYARFFEIALGYGVTLN